MITGNLPLAVVFDQRGAPVVLEIEGHAHQFVRAHGSAVGDAGVATVQNGQFRGRGRLFITLEDFLLGHVFLVELAQAVEAAHDFAVLPGDDDVGVQMFEKRIDVLLVERLDHGGLDRPQFLVGRVLLGRLLVVPPKPLAVARVHRPRMIRIAGEVHDAAVHERCGLVAG